MAFVKQFDYSIFGRGLLVDSNQPCTQSNLSFTVDSVVIDGNEIPPALLDTSSIATMESSVFTAICDLKSIAGGTPAEVIEFQDKFDGTGFLSAHTSDSGHTWDVDNGTWGGNDPQLTSGYLSNGSDWGFGVIPSYSFPDDGWVEVDIKIIDALHQQWELNARMNADGGANNALVRIFDDGGHGEASGISVEARVDGTTNTITNNGSSPTYATGDIITVRLEVSNTLVKGFINDVQVGTDITTTIPTNNGVLLFNLWTESGTDTSRILEVRAGPMP